MKDLTIPAIARAFIRANIDTANKCPADKVVVSLLNALEAAEARAEQAETDLRDSIVKQAKMSAGIDKIAAANKGLTDKAQQAEAKVDWLADQLGTLHPDCPLKHLTHRPLGWKCHEGAQGPCTKAQSAGCWKEASSVSIKSPK